MSHLSPNNMPSRASSYVIYRIQDHFGIKYTTTAPKCAFMTVNDRWRMTWTHGYLSKRYYEIFSTWSHIVLPNDSTRGCWHIMHMVLALVGACTWRFTLAVLFRVVSFIVPSISDRRFLYPYPSKYGGNNWGSSKLFAEKTDCLSEGNWPKGIIAPLVGQALYMQGCMVGFLAVSCCERPNSIEVRTHKSMITMDGTMNIVIVQRGYMLIRNVVKFRTRSFQECPRDGLQNELSNSNIIIVIISTSQSLGSRNCHRIVAPSIPGCWR
jgi:hypothetical protein